MVIFSLSKVYAGDAKSELEFGVHEKLNQFNIYIVKFT